MADTHGATLADGRRCADCRVLAHCRETLGLVTGAETWCQWSPSRFEVQPWVRLQGSEAVALLTGGWHRAIGHLSTSAHEVPSGETPEGVSR